MCETYSYDIKKILITPEAFNLLFDDKFTCQINGKLYYLSKLEIENKSINHIGLDEIEGNIIYEMTLISKDKYKVTIDKIIPPPPEAPPLRTVNETFFQNKDYPTNGNQCVICGNPIHSISVTTKVCDKCASEYKF